LHCEVIRGAFGSAAVWKTAFFSDLVQIYVQRSSEPLFGFAAAAGPPKATQGVNAVNENQEFHDRTIAYALLRILLGVDFRLDFNSDTLSVSPFADSCIRERHTSKQGNTKSESN
jgi:hypothetical protein